MGLISNIYNSNNLYLREVGKPYYYVKRSKIKITTPGNKTLYLFLDKDNHIKFTNQIKYGTSFIKKPKNYESWKKYINKKYPDSKIEFNSKVILKSDLKY